jgi:hypothetical protein
MQQHPHCLNCGGEFEGKFCPECGQKSDVQPITWRSVLHEFWVRLLNVDKGYWFTLGRLLTQPGAAVSAYIAGKRVNFVKPVQFLFVLIALNTVVGHLSKNVVRSVYGFEYVAREDLLFPRLAQFFHSYPTLMFGLLIPVASGVAWLTNRRWSRYNYWETTVFFVYVTGVFVVIHALFLALRLLFPDATSSLTPMLTVFFSYLAFAYAQFFRTTGWAWRTTMWLSFVAVIFVYLTGLSVCGFMTPWWG